MSDVRVVLVGTGVRGRIWARVIAESRDASLVAVVDADEQRARAARDEHATHAVVGTDLESALSQVDAEAVVIATPPDSHHALVVQSFDRGAHVLCEKPLSEDLGEVADLIARAEAADLHLLVGMNFRYLPTSRRIRHVTRTGELGALSHGQFAYNRHRDGNRDDLNDYVMEMPHPLLLEQSIHHFDLIRYCYGSEVDALVADSWRPDWSTYAGDCCASVLLKLENGARVNYLGTWTAAWNRMDFRWRSDFERGVLVQQEQFDDLVRVDFDPQLALRGPRFKTRAAAEPSVPETLDPLVPFVDDTRLLFGELVDAVRGRNRPVTTARDHLKSLLVVQACIESIEGSGWVSMSELGQRVGVASDP